MQLNETANLLSAIVDVTQIAWARGRLKSGMMLHKRILQWQADHPTITWVFWIIVWLVVLFILFKPARLGGMV